MDYGTHRSLTILFQNVIKYLGNKKQYLEVFVTSFDAWYHCCYYFRLGIAHLTSPHPSSSSLLKKKRRGQTGGPSEGEKVRLKSNDSAKTREVS